MVRKLTSLAIQWCTRVSLSHLKFDQSEQFLQATTCKQTWQALLSRGFHYVLINSIGQQLIIWPSRMLSSDI